ncbi:MAG: NUDIX domain-containing protein [bacterium]|nr:NUDIX domain-containing protein [bacterium]
METPEIKDKELHRVATTCIIYNDEWKYLVTKRSPHKKMQPNKWTVPGGGLNVDDYMHKTKSFGAPQWYGSLESALLREVKEEVNVEVGKPKYLLDLTFISPIGIPCLVISYYAPYVRGEVKLDEDAVDHKWVTLAEAKELDLIKGIYEEIEMVEKLLRA